MVFGKTEPRIWTPPLRELTPETTRGFEVIEFAKKVMGIDLFPWQRWLLIHALEILDDGQYRFRRVIVLVARQQGKTTLASILAAWWLFVDSRRNPEKVPPVKFKVVGVAQTLDVAAEPWRAVKMWCDPHPNTEEEAELAVPALQRSTAYVRDTNGQEVIMTRHRAHYEIRAAKNTRGKPAARAVMDELREQDTWTQWAAISQTAKSFWSNQMWGISNAGSAQAVVLKTQREHGLKAIDEWRELVEAGLKSAEEFANDHDVSIGLFEWSAPDGCAKDDREGILQANPSIGYSALTVEQCISDSYSMPDAEYRTEVLCQWVTARVNSYLDVDEWDEGDRSPLECDIPFGGRTVWAVDVSDDRKYSWIASAVVDADGSPVVQVVERREGMVWVPEFLSALADESGFREVAVRSRGCPAMELIPALERADLVVREVDGSTIGLATGRFRDAVRDRRLLHPPQPLVRTAVEGAVTKRFAENEAWDPVRSVPDIAGLVAESIALWVLEMVEPDEDAGSAYEVYELMTF